MSESSEQPIYVQTPNGLKRDHRAEWQANSATDDKSQQLGTYGIKDIRDNRDPTQVGLEYLNRKAVHGRNGNSENGTRPA